MCLDVRLLPHKLVNMNMNQNDKVFQYSELNFHGEKEHVWGPHVSDPIFFRYFDEFSNAKIMCGYCLQGLLRFSQFFFFNITIEK